MTRAAITFTEIFIVLALIFIIQTVVNFNLFDGVTEGTAEEDIPDLVTLKIAGPGLLHFRFRYQEQSGQSEEQEDQTLWFIPDEIVTPNLGAPSGFHVIEKSGRCSEYHLPDYRTSHYWNQEDEVEFFYGLLEVFGIAMNFDDRRFEDRREVEDREIQLLLSWSPGELTGTADIEVLHDLLEPNLDGESNLEPFYPVVTKTLYRGSRIIAQEPQLLGANPEDFVLPAEGISMLGPEYSGFMFTNDESDEPCRSENLISARVSVVSLDLDR